MLATPESTPHLTDVLVVVADVGQYSSEDDGIVRHELVFGLAHKSSEPSEGCHAGHLIC